MKHILLFCMVCFGMNLSAQHTITFRLKTTSNTYLKTWFVYRQPFMDKIGMTDSTGSITISGLRSGDTLTLSPPECQTYSYIVPASAPNAPVEVVVSCIFPNIEEIAEFPGGEAAKEKFMMKHFRYPESAVQQGIEGKVWVRFIVDAQGNISDVKVTKEIASCPECSQEALRLIALMPKWKPARKAGQDVKSYFNMPFKFNLN